MIGFVRGFGAASPRIGRVYKREIPHKGVVSWVPTFWKKYRVVFFEAIRHSRSAGSDITMVIPRAVS